MIPIIYKILLVVLFLFLLSIGISYVKNRKSINGQTQKTNTPVVKKSAVPKTPPQKPKIDPEPKEEKFYKPVVTNSGTQEKKSANPRIEIIRDLKSKGKK
ncbi:hypothetical protein ACSSWA_04535 [Melioribacter sp. Ez-97]|uniref:hypothetical protein n=1 Tax=Melioribacter sp. Ez-97 TaxID=3423434 RepID=UPI003EDA3CF2